MLGAGGTDERSAQDRGNEADAGRPGARRTPLVLVRTVEVAAVLRWLAPRDLVPAARLYRREERASAPLPLQAHQESAVLRRLARQARKRGEQRDAIHPRRADARPDQAAGARRPVEDGASRADGFDGRAAPHAAAVGRRPDPHGPAGDQAVDGGCVGRHGADRGTERGQAPAARDPALRLGHELRGALGRSQGLARAWRGAGAGTGICSGEGGMLPRGAGRRIQSLLLRAGISAMFGYRRVELLESRSGVPLQGRPGGQDRNRRSPARGTRTAGRSRQVRGHSRRVRPAISPPTFSRPDHDRGLPPFREIVFAS